MINMVMLLLITLMLEQEGEDSKVIHLETLILVIYLMIYSLVDLEALVVLVLEAILIELEKVQILYMV